MALIPVPGSTVEAEVRSSLNGRQWYYTLWDRANPGPPIAVGTFPVPAPNTITGEQAARIAFLLECEYR